MTKGELIEQYILEKIRSNEYSPGSKLPTVKEFCDQFDVSKMTIHKIIQKLQILGYVESIRGKGMFVTSSRMNKVINKLTSFSEDMEMLGTKSTTKLLSFDVTSEGNERAKEKLGVDSTEVLITIKRLRYVDGDPIALDIAYLRTEIIPYVDSSVLEGSLYNYIENTLKIKIQRANQSIKISYSNTEEAEYLEIEENDPVLFVEHVTYTESDDIFEYVKTIYHPDKYVFELVSYR